jgi:hypothetical protein
MNPNHRTRIYLIYKTTNLINGLIYVGFHATYNLDDGYLGSGTKLKAAILEFGYSNFKRETLEICRKTVVLEREVYWIATLNATDPSIGYNTSKGGQAGSHYHRIKDAIAYADEIARTGLKPKHVKKKKTKTPKETLESKLRKQIRKELKKEQKEIERKQKYKDKKAHEDYIRRSKFKYSPKDLY